MIGAVTIFAESVGHRLYRHFAVSYDGDGQVTEVRVRVHNSPGARYFYGWRKIQRHTLKSSCAVHCAAPIRERYALYYRGYLWESASGSAFPYEVEAYLPNGVWGYAYRVFGDPTLHKGYATFNDAEAAAQETCRLNGEAYLDRRHASTLSRSVCIVGPKTKTYVTPRYAADVVTAMVADREVDFYAQENDVSHLVARRDLEAEAFAKLTGCEFSNRWREEIGLEIPEEVSEPSRHEYADRIEDHDYGRPIGDTQAEVDAFEGAAIDARIANAYTDPFPSDLAAVRPYQGLNIYYHPNEFNFSEWDQYRELLGHTFNYYTVSSYYSHERAARIMVHDRTEYENTCDWLKYRAQGFSWIDLVTRDLEAHERVTDVNP